MDTVHENKRPWWHWALGVFGVMLFASVITQMGDKDEEIEALKQENYAQQQAIEQQGGGKQVPQGDPAPPVAGEARVAAPAVQDEKIPTEFKSAVKKAEAYSQTMNMSKKQIYNQLTSDFDQFSPEAAQYAINHAQIDYKQNALKSAQAYQKTMNMSPQAIYGQLVSNFDQFTPEEARYAVDNL